MQYRVKAEDNATKITLSNPNRLHISSIQINANGNFKRQIALTNSQGMDILGSMPYIYHLSFKGQTVNNTTIILSYSPIYAILNLKIFNRSDRPLKIKSVTVHYFRDKIIFPGEKGESYRVVVGKSPLENSNGITGLTISTKELPLSF